MADVADLCLGKMLDQEKNRGEHLPYLANVNVRWGGFDLGDLRQMRFEAHEKDRYGLKYGDIIMCEGGEPGRCAIWKDERPGMMIQKALHRIRPRNGLDNRFLYYSLLHQGKTDGFAPLFTGATIKHLPGRNLAKVEVAIPPLTAQRRIADVLSAYDDLIENNWQQIRLLETAARTAYEEWFVNFRFPGHEYTSMIDGMPEEWETKLVSDVISINPRNPEPDGASVRYVPMRALSTSGMVVDLSKSEVRTESTSVRFMNDDTLFARITPCLENGKTGYVNFLDQREIGCGSTEFIVLRGREVSSYFTYCLARTHAFRGAAIKSMIGSSGRQRVQVRCLQDFVVPVPHPHLREKFDETCEPLFRKITTLQAHRDALVKARDLLLHRLMNGETAA